MIPLTGRERLIFTELAHVLIDEPAVPVERILEGTSRFLSQCTRQMRWTFRIALLAFEWGAFFLVTGEGRFEHFSGMTGESRRRYVRLWMNHRAALPRQIFTLFKMLILASFYDDRSESARLGYAPGKKC